MITKILITIVMIILVGLIFKTRTAERAKAIRKAELAEQAEPKGSLSVRTVAFLIIGILLVISATIFVFKYQADNRIVNIRVISEDGAGTVYQARQKDIKGRIFITLDNRQVTLGESDRVEMENR